LFLPDKDDVAKSTFRNFMTTGENTHRIIWEIYQDTEGRYWAGEEFGIQREGIGLEKNLDSPIYRYPLMLRMKENNKIGT